MPRKIKNITWKKKFQQQKIIFSYLDGFHDKLKNYRIDEIRVIIKDMLFTTTNNIKYVN